MNNIEKLKEIAGKRAVFHGVTYEIDDITPKYAQGFELRVSVHIFKSSYSMQFEYAFNRDILEDAEYDTFYVAIQQWYQIFRRSELESRATQAFSNLSTFAKQRFLQVFDGHGHNFELDEKDLYEELVQSQLVEDNTFEPFEWGVTWYRVVRPSDLGFYYYRKVAKNEQG